VFVHFLEAFLGIEPHFVFFWSLYILTPLPSTDKMGRMGCTHLQLRPEVVGKYLEWTPIHVDPNWKGSWFYISNPTPALPNFFAEPPVFVREWFLKYNSSYKDQVRELLERIVLLRKIRVIAASVLLNYTQRRIQLL